MKRPNFLAFILLVGSLIFAGCKKDKEAVVQDPEPEACLVKTVSGGTTSNSPPPEWLYMFEYNSKGRMSQFRMFANYTSFEYDASGKVTLAEHKGLNNTVGATTSYRYDSQGRWSQVVTKPITGIGTDMRTATYDGENKISRIDYFSQYPGSIRKSYTLFIYENGNMVETSSYDNSTNTPSLVFSSQFEYYPDKPNNYIFDYVDAFEGLVNLPGLATKSKNLLKKRTGSDGSTKLYTYELNDKGYPTKVSYTKSGSPDVYNQFYTYQCQ